MAQAGTSGVSSDNEIVVQASLDNTVDAAVSSQLSDALRNLRFGIVSIIVQDGVVVQIDRTERFRLRQPKK